MIGIENPGIIWAYILTIGSVLLCIAWGILYWNKGQIDQQEKNETVQWDEKEEEITKEL